MVSIAGPLGLLGLHPYHKTTASSLLYTSNDYYDPLDDFYLTIHALFYLGPTNYLKLK